MTIPIYEGISRSLSTRKSDLLGGVDSDDDLGGLAIWRERRVGFVWLIGVDTHRQMLSISCCLDVCWDLPSSACSDFRLFCHRLKQSRVTRVSWT
jgi:hypothetical protein